MPQTDATRRAPGGPRASCGRGHVRAPDVGCCHKPDHRADRGGRGRDAAGRGAPFPWFGTTFTVQSSPGTLEASISPWQLLVGPLLAFLVVAQPWRLLRRRQRAAPAATSEASEPRAPLSSAGAASRVHDMDTPRWQDADFTGLRAIVFNCTLKRSPEKSHTQGLIDVSTAIMEKHGVEVEVLRPVDHDIATGVYPDMTEHGWERDEWPEIWERVRASDIIVIAGPIWLGDNSSVTKQVIERLYAMSGLTNDRASTSTTARSAGRSSPATRTASSTARPTSSTASSTSAARSRPTRTPAGSARPGPARPTSTRAAAAPRTSSPSATRPS